MTSEEKIRSIPLDELQQAVRTLRKVRENYRISANAGSGWDALVQGELILVLEIRAQYGQEAWEAP